MLNEDLLECHRGLYGCKAKMIKKGLQCYIDSSSGENDYRFSKM